MRKDITRLSRPVYINATSSAVGKDEHLGPLGSKFDIHDDTDRFGGDTWEHAEAGLSEAVFNMLIKNSRTSPDRIDLLLSGDLQNQCVASSEAHSHARVPYLGLYGACSTCGEGLLIAALALQSEDICHAAVITTSHYCAAERQYRTPLEYGSQRTPTAQWTATAGGGFMLSRSPRGVMIDSCMAGRIIDSGIRDAGNMGAAMAPAVCDSLLRYFDASHTCPDDYSAIITGDLGHEGSEILQKLMLDHGVSLKKTHFDCGELIYDRAKQDAHSGGSGCGCSASVMAAHFCPLLCSGELQNALFLATGALMSPSSLQQGGTISGIAPVVSLRHMEE